ncbi:MAG: DMT family transporter, partial [Acidobacteria bacterium]|nr:DMT family transporter [Acidobacteriota bacterium]
RDDAGVNVGDLLTLVSTTMFALHMTLLSVYARRFDVRQITVLQIASAAAFISLAWVVVRASAVALGAEALPAFAAREAAPLAFDARIVAQLLYLAAVATVAVFFLWTWGQSRTTPTHAAVIFSLEPVFATFFAVLVRGPEEWMGGRGWAGAGLVFAGIVVSELRWAGRGRAAGAAAEETPEEEEVLAAEQTAHAAEGSTP